MAISHHGVHTSPLASSWSTPPAIPTPGKHTSAYWCLQHSCSQAQTAPLSAFPSFYLFWFKKKKEKKKKMLKKIPFATRCFSDLGSLKKNQFISPKQALPFCGKGKLQNVSGLEDEAFWKLLLQQDGHATSCAKLFPCRNWKPWNSNLKAKGKQNPHTGLGLGTDKDLAVPLEEEIKQEEIQLSTCLQSRGKAT